MKKYIEIKCILDKSGSMSSIIESSIAGFNSFLKSQQESGDNIKMSILLFDNKFEKICDRININEVKPFTRETYVPDASTALYDAIGISLDEHVDMLAQLKPSKRPEKTLWCILSDGFENASTKYSKELINKLINEHREFFKGEFIFLAANQDACLTAEGLGISRGNSFTYDYSNQGATIAYCTLNDAVSTYKASSETKCDNLIQ